MSRYEQATTDVYKIMNDLIGDHFSYLAGANIEILFDTKKKKKDGRYRLGAIQTTNDLTKFLTMSDEGTPADYIMYLDKEVFTSIDDADKKRIIFHELCHCSVDLESKNPYKVRDHEIQGFYDELKFNEDDPKWTQRLSTIAESIHEDDE